MCLLYVAQRDWKTTNEKARFLRVDKKWLFTDYQRCEGFGQEAEIHVVLQGNVRPWRKLVNSWTASRLQTQWLVFCPSCAITFSCCNCLSPRDAGLSTA